MSEKWTAGYTRDWSLRFRLAAWLIGLVGVGRAAWHYSQAHTFFIDEVKLLWNVADRDWSALLEPLQNNQVAAVGFLIVEKAIVSTLGVSEISSRLLALLSMALAVVLFVQISRRVLSPIPGIMAMVLFAWGGPLIYYASQSKQYTLDVLVSELILLATLSLIDNPAKRSHWMVLAILGCIATGFSIPAIIVLGGSTTTLIVVSWQRGQPSQVRAAVGIGFLWALCFGLLYVWKYRFEGDSEYMAGYWSIGFLPPPWQPVDFARALLGHGDRLMREVVGIHFRAAGLVAYVIGMLMLLFRRRPIGVLMASTMFLAVLLSSLHLYPLKERAALYLLPYLVIPIAAVSEEAANSRELLSKVAAAVLMALVLIGPVTGLAHVETRADIKPVIEKLLDEVEAGDVVYIYWRPQRVLDFYDRWDIGPELMEDPRLQVVRGEAHIDEPLKYIDAVEDLVETAGLERVWFLYSRRYKEKGLDEVEIYRRAFEERGELILELISTDAGAWLFELSSKQ